MIKVKFRARLMVPRGFMKGTRLKMTGPRDGCYYLPECYRQCLGN